MLLTKQNRLYKKATVKSSNMVFPMNSCIVCPVTICQLAKFVNIVKSLL